MAGALTIELGMGASMMVWEGMSNLDVSFCLIFVCMCWVELG